MLKTIIKIMLLITLILIGAGIYRRHKYRSHSQGLSIDGIIEINETSSPIQWKLNGEFKSKEENTNPEINSTKNNNPDTMIFTAQIERWSKEKPLWKATLTGSYDFSSAKIQTLTVSEITAFEAASYATQIFINTINKQINQGIIQTAMVDILDIVHQDTILGTNSQIKIGITHHLHGRQEATIQSTTSCLWDYLIEGICTLEGQFILATPLMDGTIEYPFHAKIRRYNLK